MKSTIPALPFRTVAWTHNHLVLLDQTQLPARVVYAEQHTLDDVYNAIRQLKVRGAPAIGVAAAYGLLLAVRDRPHERRDAFMTALERGAERLDAARPTAVNLGWALRRMIRHARSLTGADPKSLYDALVQEADRIHAEDRNLCLGIGEQGLPLLEADIRILTHCNAGALATTGIGTALAPIYRAQAQGMPVQVFADETRPLLQGARLTCWELQQAGVPVTLICDNMAASLMAAGKIDLVITGCDRVAANGDIANKVGTLGVAILARHFNIPFYVACPSSTIDHATPDGAGMPIENRDGAEVRTMNGKATAPADIPVMNPAFDVTPAGLITGIVTERAILRPPYGPALARFRDTFPSAGHTLR